MKDELRAAAERILRTKIDGFAVYREANGGDELQAELDYDKDAETLAKAYLIAAAINQRGGMKDELLEAAREVLSYVHHNDKEAYEWWRAHAIYFARAVIADREAEETMELPESLRDAQAILDLAEPITEEWLASVGFETYSHGEYAYLRYNDLQIWTSGNIQWQERSLPRVKCRADLVRLCKVLGIELKPKS